MPKARICTFGVQIQHPIFEHLKEASIVIGCSYDDYDKRIITAHFAKTRYPKFQWYLRPECHIKYALFEKDDRFAGFIGSMNLTNSQSSFDELMLELTQDQCKEILKLHARLVKGAREAKESPRDKLDSEQLSSLLSTPVRQ